ncbi:hypothetical protein [Devosia sp. DBB001]|nr:hypothetical protein [Devosia sp. DBB001]
MAILIAQRHFASTDFRFQCLGIFAHRQPRSERVYFQRV